MTYEEKANLFVDKVCDYYEINTELLSKGTKRYRIKVYNNLHIDYIRMALCLFISENTPLFLVKIAEITGYKDHSSVVRAKKKAYVYLQSNDKIFLDFWNPINEIGKLFIDTQILT